MEAAGWLIEVLAVTHSRRWINMTDNKGRAMILLGFSITINRGLSPIIIKNWVSGIPQYICPQGYKPDLGALLNPKPLINSNYGKSVLLKDAAAGYAGSTTETITKETWDKVNGK